MTWASNMPLAAVSFPESPETILLLAGVGYLVTLAGIVIAVSYGLLLVSESWREWADALGGAFDEADVPNPIPAPAGDRKNQYDNGADW